MQPIRTALVVLLFCSGALFAKAPATTHYLAPNALNVRALLPGPPAQGSAANQADIDAVLRRQARRTPEQIARAKAEADLSPAAFAPVFGKWFTAEKLPLTFALLKNATEDAEAISGAAKSYWNRPRPPFQDAAIHPAVPVPPNASYPSGHAMRGTLWAAILSQLAPEKAGLLRGRGEQIGEDRIIAGVHFPTDVAGGRTLGQALAKRFLANAEFQHDLARAAVEFATAQPRSPEWFEGEGRTDMPGRFDFPMVW